MRPQAGARQRPDGAPRDCVTIPASGQRFRGFISLAACKIAKVEPRFEQLNWRDALAYIVSANLARRNLTKGQQAMALAMIYPEPERGCGKKDEARQAAVSAGFSGRRLAEARSVLRHSHVLADSVIKGSVSLDEALATAEELKQQANSTEAKASLPAKATAANGGAGVIGTSIDR
jgi:hypothetical protein